MGRDLITDSTNRQNANDAKRAIASFPWRFWHLTSVALYVKAVAKLLGAMALGALLLALVYQIPAVHSVDIGGYDAAYVQGFYDPEPSDAPWLAGSDGSARWTRDVSYLLLPQAGLPAQVALRLRGRPTGPAPEVIVRLNGARELGRFRPGAAWEEHTFTIDGGLLKPNDVVIEISGATAPLGAEDPRLVGVLLDRATYRTGTPPLIPYPAQLIYGALAAGMLYLLTRGRGWRMEDGGWRTANRPSSILYLLSSLLRWPFALGLLALCCLFLVLYRLQPPYPYPLRGLLPVADGLLAALLALRYGPAVAQRAPALLDGLALGGIGLWTAAILLVAQNHTTLSTPGVETDFGVFARRSAQLTGGFQPSGQYSAAVDGVLRADGFYNLGYPLLLWIARQFTQDNAFLAARLIAALSGALLLGAAWWLARRLLGRAAALLVVAVLAFSPQVVEYALYVGTDMLFAALCTLALALLLATTDHRPPTTDQRPTTDDEGEPAHALTRSRAHPTIHPPSSILHPRSVVVVLAGLAAGAAFLVRHPGLLLLPFGWLAIWMIRTENREPQIIHHTSRITHHASRFTDQALFTLAFLIAISPQLIVNTLDTGQPLYNQQAKNVWLCVYGSCDWGHWDEAPNDITLSEIVLRDPGRFLASWAGNVRGFFGTGGEDTSEFGRAIQLRLLGFPANWLALGGLLAWLALGLRGRLARSRDSKPTTSSIRGSAVTLALAVWVVLYALTVSVGIPLPRFFLPLAPVYAIAAAWAFMAVADHRPPTTDHRPPTTDDKETRRQGDKEAEQSLISNLQSLERFVTQHSTLNTQNFRLIVAMLLLVALWGGFATGASYVLGHQPDEEVAAIQLVQTTLRPGERLVVRVPPRVEIGKYSAIAHLVAPERGQYLLSLGGAAPGGGAVVGTAGRYTLYRITP